MAKTEMNFLIALLVDDFIFYITQDTFAKNRINHGKTATQRLALAAVGGRVDLPPKREKLKATKKLQKRAESHSSGARCVSRPHYSEDSFLKRLIRF
jgi:hypothetical protein